MSNLKLYQLLSLMIYSGIINVHASPLAANSQLSGFFHHKSKPSSSIRDGDEDAPEPNPKDIMWNPFWAVPGGNFDSWNSGLWTNPFWNYDPDANDVFWAVNPPADNEEDRKFDQTNVEQESSYFIPFHLRSVAPKVINSSSDDAVVESYQPSSVDSNTSTIIQPSFKLSKEDWAAIYALNQAIRENPRLVYKILSQISQTESSIQQPASNSDNSN